MEKLYTYNFSITHTLTFISIKIFHSCTYIIWHTIIIAEITDEMKIQIELSDLHKID